nr:right-handed parallel beta-helix repeat-containing protein [Haloechinothrix aidingensis]
MGNVCDVVIERNHVVDIDPERSGEGIGISTHGDSDIARSEHVRISGNVVDGVGGRGIVCATSSGLDQSAGTARHIAIRSNTVTDVDEDSSLGIELYNRCHDSVIEDNRLDHGISVVHSHNVGIRRNRVVDTRAGADGFIGLEVGNVRDAVLADNVVDSGVQYGGAVLAWNGFTTRRVTAVRNDFRNARETGLWLMADNDGLSGIEYVYARGGTCPASGGGTKPCGVTGTDGTGERGDGHGVLLWHDTRFVTLDDLAITDNAGAGVSGAGVQADYLAVLGNTFSGNSEPANWSLGAWPSNMRWAGNDCAGDCDGLTSGEWATDGWDPPDAAIAMPSTATVGEPVTFTSRSTDSEGISDEQWDLGTGVPRSADGTVRYTEPGTYRVSLTVWNTKGQADSAEHVITVEP